MDLWVLSQITWGKNCGVTVNEPAHWEFGLVSWIEMGMKFNQEQAYTGGPLFGYNCVDEGNIARKEKANGGMDGYCYTIPDLDTCQQDKSPEKRP